MTRFPQTLDDVTAGWLDRALHASGAVPAGAAVAGFTVQGIGAGFGQTGDSVRLLLDYSGDPGAAPASVFAKFATANAARRAASQSLDLYRREVRFYTEILGRTGVRAPRCHFAEASPEGDLATLLLEDFPDHRPGDDIQGVTPDEAARIVTTIAGLHAHYWNRAETAGIAPLHMGGPERYSRAWDVTAATFGTIIAPEVLRHKDRFIPAIDGLHHWLTTGATTVGHGDLKLDNILFGPDPEAADGVVLVDWQAVRPQRGIRDVAYLICHSMSVPVRRAHDRALLRLWQDRLRGHGVDYPEAALTEDYRRAILYDFCTALYIAGVNPNDNERANRRKAALLERVSAALTDWACFDLI